MSCPNTINKLITCPTPVYDNICTDNIVALTLSAVLSHLYICLCPLHTILQILRVVVKRVRQGRCGLSQRVYLYTTGINVKMTPVGRRFNGVGKLG